MNEDEIALLEVHTGNREGQSFIVCGVCKTKRRADEDDGGPLMALARHIAHHKARP